MTLHRHSLRRWAAALAFLTVVNLGAVANAAPAAPKLADLAAVRPVKGCEALVQADLAAAAGAPVKIAAAAVVTGARPYCRVQGTISQAIGFEVRLPVEAWTQRYLQTGCGGLCGTLNVRPDRTEDCTPVTDGQIVLASTDMGHKQQPPGQPAAWGDDPAKRADFAYRGVHATALVAKALIAAFYGQVPKYSYFSGCSDGGREALMEAQRYPGDFDGIAAGAPALNFTYQNSFYHAWQALSNTGADGKAIINPIDLPVLHKGALAACDSLDGLADGQITDPRACRFDPASVRCTGAGKPGECLTDVQVAAARKLYTPPADATGQRLVPGSVQPGSELSWAGVFIPRQDGGQIFSENIALEALRSVLFEPGTGGGFKLTDLKFDRATFDRLAASKALYNADDPDLSAFSRRGGKLILFHGWSDPHITPLGTIDYFDKVGARMGAASRDAFTRLFLLPGVYHCNGGDGPSDFPLLATLMSWVEGGVAPTEVTARRVAERAPGGAPPGAEGRPPGGPGGPGGPPPGAMAPPPAAAPVAPRSRPVYAYPMVARYSGRGPVDEASSFVAVKPATAAARVAWAGAGR